ncbi:MAG: hypothetical protein M3Q33_05300 [Acidobacteriota bacterium]|nr:hypothetical protein [Acidobacteriota bacterium]
MSKVQILKPKVEDDSIEILQIIDGELLEVSSDKEVEPEKLDKISTKLEGQRTKDERQNQKSYLQYIFMPLIFLTVALLGGLRFGAADSAFIFLKPPLVCLIFATLLIVLFFRAHLIKLDGWFSESFSTLKNIANGAVLLALFAASAQVFNALLPESGLPFWIIAFCFFWTLWNNLFAEFDTKRLIQSLGGLFGLAFVVKYMVLANLTAPASESWWQTISSGNLTKGTFTYLLDLPKFSPATGYVQFFALVLYLIGLFLVKPEIKENAETRTK